jgi:antitoxin HicB
MCSRFWVNINIGEVMKRHSHIGSSLNDFLAEEDLLVESELIAIKRIVAMELGKTIVAHETTKKELACKIGTSRAAIDRLLDPQNTSITLHTLDKAARAIGKKLHLSLIERENTP